MSVSGCHLVWKSVLGDSTVQVATLNLAVLRESEAIARRAILLPHIGRAEPGYALTMAIPTGTLRLELGMALERTVDSAATRVVVIADVDSALVDAYVVKVNAALQSCRAKGV
jgi:hypothetical protein